MLRLEKELKVFTVLLVEDDEDVKVRLRNILSFYFKDVYEASDGDMAYKIFLSKKPNLIISDIVMQYKNGIYLVKKIRQTNLSVPIIILSAYPKEEYLLKLINLKIDQYLLKPTTNKELFLAISKVLCGENYSMIELCENIFLDTDNNQVIFEDKKIDLRKKEKDFLELLCRNRNRITKYFLIQDYVWTDKYMSQDALKTFVKELRKKLPKNIIENIKQEGYKLI
ncbi:MAG: response regulator transcription factor [Sulfurospirillum sp.]